MGPESRMEICIISVRMDWRIQSDLTRIRLLGSLVYPNTSMKIYHDAWLGNKPQLTSGPGNESLRFRKLPGVEKNMAYIRKPESQKSSDFVYEVSKQ